MIRLLSILALLVGFSTESAAQSSSVRPPDDAAVGGPPPTNLMPESSDSDIWRMIRQGAPETGPADRPMIQSEGDLWRIFRNGAYQDYALIGFVGLFALLAFFYGVRGRVGIEGGWSGVTIKRFGFLERFVHWLTASSFIVLAISGLNIAFGDKLLLPWIGKETFAMLTGYGKIAHNFLGISFLVGIALMFMFWVWHNIPHPRDVMWVVKGGGIVPLGHPHATKFNAGQKVIFWVTILGGASLGMSGIALMFPNEFTFFAQTTPYLNQWFGLDLPTTFSPIQEQQLNQAWHGVVGMALTAIIVAHIYIGTLGMRGAFAAMGRGQVDLNWAEEHHSLWVEKLRRQGKVPSAPKTRAKEVAAE